MRGERESTGELCDMEVEAGGVEGPVIVVAVSGLKITRGIEPRRVPEPAPKVREQGEVWP